MSGSSPHISLTDETVARLLRRRKLGSYYMNDVRFLDSRIKLLEEEVTRLQEQLGAANERLSQYEEPGWTNAIQKVIELKEQLESYRGVLEKLASDRERQRIDQGIGIGSFVRGALASFPASEPDDGLCRCGGYAKGDHNFDRSLCACGAMHYYCNVCGSQGDPCVSNQDTRDA